MAKLRTLSLRLTTHLAETKSVALGREVMAFNLKVGIRTQLHYVQPTCHFHTSILGGLLGNPKSIIYDLDIQEPRKPEEWVFRYVRYGKSKKEWRRVVPMGIPQLEFIPEGHVDRAGRRYTVDILPWKKTEGRHPETGRRTNFRVGGGAPRDYRMLDTTRNVPLGERSPFVERVLEIVEDETRTAHLALVANGNFKRFIIASENMKAGDLIKTHNRIPRNPVQAFEGDAFPVGALAIGTMVHNVETQPGEGGTWAFKAGEYGTIVNKIADRVVVSMWRHKRQNQEISIDERCMATVGRVSNLVYYMIPIGSAWMKRKLGYRSRSGLFQKKDGRFGRRIKPPPDMKVFEPPARPFTPVYKDS